MEVIITADPQSASRQAALYFKSLLRRKKNAILGLATGGTPVLLYQELIRLHRAGELDFSQSSTFNLDEYMGLGPEHPASYRRFMQDHLFASIQLPAANIHIPDGLAADVPAHAAAYEKAIVDAGGIDLQLLGVGSDGHIGFNEPSSSLASRTRIKTLSERTRSDNAHFFAAGEEVPYHVITMGIGTILDAREIVLLAFGDKKADAVAALVEGPVSAMVPASALQLHPSVRVIIDEAAAGKLQRKEYYRHVFDFKPAWQKQG